MRKTLVVLMLALTPTVALAQTRLAFVTAASPFVDDAQKQRDKAVKDLVEDFTHRAAKDHVVVVSDPDQAQIVVTVQSMRVEANGEHTVQRGVFGGLDTSPTKAEHMIVELRVGDYTTTIGGWRTIIQTAEDQVGREIRRWLKDNAASLGSANAGVR